MNATRIMHCCVLLILLGLCLPAAAQDSLPAPEPAPTSPTQPAGPSSRPVAKSSPRSTEEIEDLNLLNLQVPEVPMVVTASRREEKLADLPYAISVITADDIRRSGARSVPDALRLVPGMDVADISSGLSGVSPRGFHGAISRLALILVDGRQIYDPIFGGTVWGAWPFQLEDIDRIEVIRGPGGVTWGSNAVNGVINIITKDPKNQQGLTSTAAGGSRGMHKEHEGYGFTDGPLRMRVSGEYEANDGFQKGGSWLRGLNDEYKTGRGTAYGIYDAGPKDKLNFSIGNALVEGGYPTTPLGGIGVSQNASSQASFLMNTWTHTISKDNSFNLTGYVNDFYVCPGTPITEYRYQQLALQFGHTFKPADGHTLSWGIDSRTDLVDGTLADPPMLSKGHMSTAIIGAFVQDNWKFAPRWALDLGARLDYEFYGGFEPSARIALSYELTEHSLLYGSVSRAFHTPTAASRYLDISLMNGLARLTTNPEIGDETVIAYELGYRGKFFDKLDTNINLYWNDYTDLSATKLQLGPPGLVQEHFDNRSSPATYGVEFDNKYALTRTLTLLGNYTYQQVNWDADVPFTNQDFITPPKHKFMLGARYDPLSDLHLSSHLYYVDAVHAPNPNNPLVSRCISQYFRLDLRAEYEFWKKQASVAVGVNNLLQANHYEGSTLQTNSAEVPRMIYAEFRMTIK